MVTLYCISVEPCTYLRKEDFEPALGRRPRLTLRAERLQVLEADCAGRVLGVVGRERIVVSSVAGGAVGGRHIVAADPEIVTKCQLKWRYVPDVSCWQG